MLLPRLVPASSGTRCRQPIWGALLRPTGAPRPRSPFSSSERTGSIAVGADEPRLSLQADRIGSWAAVAMALQRTRRSGLAGDLCRDAAHAGGVEGTDQQDRPQRCTRHGADDAGWTLPSGACEDVTQPETADAADAS